MDDPQSSLVPGFRLDRYELLCPIASGGMASVWLARLRGKRGFEKLFAIKTIKTELISDPHFQEMFLDEARIASRIIHPNVAQIVELGEQDDILFIVMEYVDGDSLAKVNRLANKRGSPLPPGVSMRIVAETCAGLHAAHQLKDQLGDSLGVVHRDVSPQNILLTTSGSAKVIDFGLVKAKNRSSAETQSGVVKGKIRYMAPEQVGGKSIDHRADVWACGMCLYELITGHTPYHEDDDLAVVKRLMSEDPLPPFHVALPPQIEKILSKAIVRDPDGRYESCAAMRRAIEAAIHELNLAAENDDVSDFVKDTLPELAAKRTKTIQKAIEAAESRITQVPSLEGLGSPDMVFAATEVSGRTVQSEEVSLALTRKRGESGGEGESGEEYAAEGESGEHAESDESVPSTISSYGAHARTTSTTTRLSEQLQDRKKKSGMGFWLAGLSVVGAAAFILWPRASSNNNNNNNNNSNTNTAPITSAATSVAPPVSASIPPPASASASSTSIELDPTADNAALDAGAATSAKTTPSASPSASSSSSSVASRPTPGPTPPPSSTTAQAGPPYDGGLSPGAMSAARIMLVRPPETPPQPPPDEHPQVKP